MSLGLGRAEEPDERREECEGVCRERVDDDAREGVVRGGRCGGGPCAAAGEMGETAVELGAREEDGEGMETGERGAWKRPMSVGARSVYAGGSMEGPMDFVRSGPGSFSLLMPMPEIMVASGWWAYE